MRFKVGDKVRVKEGLVGGNIYGDIFLDLVWKNIAENVL